MRVITNGKCSFDEYNTEGYKFNLDSPLSAFQTNLINKTFPSGAILSAEYTRDEWLPCPIRIKLSINGEIKTVYLRMTRLKNGVKNEAYILPILKNLGINVPLLYSEAVIDPDFPEIGAMAIISEIKGNDVYSHFNLENEEKTKKAKKTILKGINTLYSLTDKLKELGADKILPVITLKDELYAIKQRKGEWFSDSDFIETVRMLDLMVEDIDEQLVFSSGDINPCNFLCENGEISGYIDFSHSCFKDPLYGFATYITYYMNPFNGNGLIEDYLASINKTKDDFIPRLLLRTLWTLQRELSPLDDNDFINMLRGILINKSFSV